MKNNYITKGDVTEIELNHRSKGKFIALIDTEDLPIASSILNSWCANVNYRDKVYVATTQKGKNVKLHRLIIECPEDKQVDHINGNPLDNRKVNLRAVTPSENQLNRQKAQSNSKSGVRGVSWDKERNKWRAIIRVEGKQRYLGHYLALDEAERAVRVFLFKNVIIPEEIRLPLQKYYKYLSESTPDEYTIGQMDGVMATLDILGLKIAGINGGEC
ncbi:HNH endonuclease [Bacillus sp. AFS073361]|uniref:HNH endonuclease n=1 Tax=Bacillus sp. AFS073361 TaxID=2033511 RepID=UPI001C551849|nr:HNH endonuclease [Bacillus sp. AFS073361]